MANKHNARMLGVLAVTAMLADSTTYNNKRRKPALQPKDGLNKTLHEQVVAVINKNKSGKKLSKSEYAVLQRYTQ